MVLVNITETLILIFFLTEILGIVPSSIAVGKGVTAPSLGWAPCGFSTTSFTGNCHKESTKTGKGHEK